MPDWPRGRCARCDRYWRSIARGTERSIERRIERNENGRIGERHAQVPVRKEISS